MNADRITAGEIRALGIPVPLEIPDCGHISRVGFAAAMAASARGANISSVDNTLSINMSLQIDEPFQWIELTVVAEKKGGAA